MSRRPTMNETEAAQTPEREEQPDTLGYYTKRERWERLGREVATFRDQAKRAGVPIESLPGARATIEAFKKAGADLDRRVR